MRLCGCELSSGDVDRLLDLLVDHGSPISVEAAAALAWNRGNGRSIDTLEPEIRRAIVRAVEGVPVDNGLAVLRDVLLGEDLARASTQVA